MKKTVIALMMLCAAGAVSAQSGKKQSQQTKVQAPLCADDVCLKLSQAVNLAMISSKNSVIVTGEAELQKEIPNAHEEMVSRTKVHRDNIRALYTQALASVKRSPPATAALKDYMVIATAALSSFPNSLFLSRGQQRAEYQSYETRLNDAWARVQLEAEL